MKITLVKAQTDIRNWPAVAAAVALALFMAVVVCVTVEASLVVIALLAVVGAVLSGVAWIDAVWEGYERRAPTNEGRST